MSFAATVVGLPFAIAVFMPDRRRARMNERQTHRLWLSWEAYMREWCRLAEFRTVLSALLHGEDAVFRKQIERICAEEQAGPKAQRQS